MRGEVEAMPARTPQREDLSGGRGLPIGTGVGAAIGLILGQMLGQLALGLVVGAAVGLVTGTVATTSADIPADRRGRVFLTAIAIAVAGVVATMIVVFA